MESGQMTLDFWASGDTQNRPMRDT
jgi:hypothetical protein